MNKKISTIIVPLLLSVSTITVPARAQVGSVVELGVGARAMAFAGNHVASTDNLSAVYWNPAALAFLPVREMHVAFDGFRITGETTLDEARVTIPRRAQMSGDADRLRMTSIGIVHAIPTTQGGLTVALSRDKPIMFDDLTVYTYYLNEVTTHVNSRREGDMNRWSGALGIQVAPNISAGVTLSYISGKETGPVLQTKRHDRPQPDNGYSDPYLLAWPEGYYDVRLDNKYSGFAMVLGAMFVPIDNLKIGARVNAIRAMWLESWEYHLYDPSYFAETGHGYDARVYSAPSGSVGAEYKLPWITVTGDLRLTMPYTFSSLPAADRDRMPDDVQAGYFKYGGGLGLEVPLPSIPVVLRGGYSFDDYDLYAVIARYDGERIDWDYMGRGGWPTKNRHTVGLGLGVFTSGIGFELSYSYQTWGIRSDYNEAGYRQDYSSHRITTAFTYRY